MILLLRNLSLLEYILVESKLKGGTTMHLMPKKHILYLNCKHRNQKTSQNEKGKNERKKFDRRADFQCGFHNKASSSVFFC